MERAARAAILAAPGEDVRIEEITLEEPGPDEAVVGVAASGVCHTDLHVKRSGGWGLPFPILLGHEGAGIVEEIGSNVTDVGYDREEIAAALRAQIEHGPYGHEPIYGDGRAGERIADILSRNTVRIDKRITY